jgi:hypothetical protein
MTGPFREAGPVYATDVDQARRRIREKGRVEGRTEGLAAAIANVLATRFDLSMRTYHQLEQRLLTITDVYRLQVLLQTAVLTPDVASFEQALED